MRWSTFNGCLFGFITSRTLVLLQFLRSERSDWEVVHIFFGIPRRELRWLRLLLEYVRSESRKSEEVSLRSLSLCLKIGYQMKATFFYSKRLSGEIRWQTFLFTFRILPVMGNSGTLFEAATTAGGLVGFLSGSLWEICMFSLCLCGFLLGSLKHICKPKTLSVSQGAIWLGSLCVKLTAKPTKTLFRY